MNNAIVILIATILPVWSTIIPGSASTAETTETKAGSNTSLGEEPIRTICTHAGVFHSDEALGCYMLKVLYPNATILRSRDPELFESCDVVLDVGMEYDPDRKRYDHHQQNFSETASSLSTTLRSGIRLSSAGLIYHHFGRAVLQKLTGEKDETVLDYLYRMLYYSLIQEIDGIDNGVPQHNSSRSQYIIGSDLSSRVSRLNRPFIGVESWNDSAEFEKAMALAGDEFEQNVVIILQQEYPAREVVEKAIEKRYDVHSSGQIIDLGKYCPWENHVFEIEEQKRIQSQIKFVLFPVESEYDVQCVPVTLRSYDCRKPLPSSWRGLQDAKLSRKVGIEGCVYTHANGYIGGHKSRDGALQMAIKSLQNDESNEK